jgi:hypothetical protein
VLTVALGVEVFGLLFTSGIIYSGAVFALAMMISIGVLGFTIPPALLQLARWYKGVDVFMTIAALVVGFFLGPTMAVSLVFFGLCLSGSLRVLKAIEPDIKADFDWSSVLPARVLKWLREIWSWFKGSEEVTPQTQSESSVPTVA